MSEHWSEGIKEAMAKRGLAIVPIKATDALVDRFLAWPLPDSVCSDLCATKSGYPHRSGTNLLTAVEAKQMIEYLLAPLAAAQEIT
jgi:hypothetical protein